MHSRKVEAPKLGLGGRKRSANEMIGAVGEAVFDIVAGRTDPEDIARFNADTRGAITKPNRLRCPRRLRRHRRLMLPSVAAVFDQPQRAADQQTGYDVLAEFIEQRHGRETEIIDA